MGSACSPCTRLPVPVDKAVGWQDAAHREYASLLHAGEVDGMILQQHHGQRPPPAPLMPGAKGPMADELPLWPKRSVQPNLGLPPGQRPDLSPEEIQEMMLVPVGQTMNLLQLPLRNPMTILWVLFIVLVIYALWVVLSASTPENPDLRNVLVRYSHSQMSFVAIRRFKQCMNTMAGSMASVPNRRECNGAYWPDTFGIMHHEGLLLEVHANGQYDEQATSYLELDYGRDGLAYRETQAVPALHAVIPEERGPVVRRFQKAAIPFERGSPARLVELLDRISGWRYNLFTFNCNDFVDIVWNLYVT